MALKGLSLYDNIFTPLGGDANGKSHQLKLTRRLAINLSEFTLKCRGQIYIRNQDGVANVSVVIRKKSC